jgi:hypothetical protein
MDCGGRSRAHHGSAANNTSQLFDRLEAPLWLVSSSGARHGPGPEAIARIVLAGRDGRRLVFNYRSAFNNVSSSAGAYRAISPPAGLWRRHVAGGRRSPLTLRE